MKRRKTSRLTAKGKTYTCVVCSKTMFSKVHFTKHINGNKICKSQHPHNCITCGFVGHTEYSLFSHLAKTAACQHFHTQKGVASGLMRTIPSESVAKVKPIPHTTSHIFNWYSTDGLLDKVQLNIHDETLQKRVNVRTFNDCTLKDGNLQ